MVTSDTTTSSVTSSTDQTSSCHEERYWPYFLIPSISVFILGIIVITVYRTFQECARKKRQRFKKLQNKNICCSMKNTSTNSCKITSFVIDDVTQKGNCSIGTPETDVTSPGENLDYGNLGDDVDGVIDDEDEEYGRNDKIEMSEKKKRGFLTVLKINCEQLISAQTIPGRILVSLSFVFSILSLVLYMIDAMRIPPMESLFSITDKPLDACDFMCNMFFFLHFILKFIAANDKLRFWIQLTSIVDIFIVPPIFAAIKFGRQWLGLRFVCAFRLLNFPDVLQYLRILKTSNQIRLVELFSMFFCMWITSAGFIHLVENSGDPFSCYQNAKPMNYWDSMYLVVITMSTVGYGDIFCTTVIGKLFIVVFIFGAVALFASYVPEVIEIFKSTRQTYLTEYKKEIGLRHLVVGGHVSLETVQKFVRDFTHDDRISKDIKGIFMDLNDPGLEINALFKRNYNKIVFIKGCMMNPRDLKKVRLQEAEAVMILTNQSATSADSEDTENIMRAIAVKNYCPSVRVVLQIIKMENKAVCTNLPFWTERDHIICLCEMKMGFMAASCLAPGFSTFLTNLLFMFTYEKSPQDSSWKSDYLKGAEMEVYTEKFSSFFHGRSVPEVVEFCYTRLHLLLVAVAGSTDANNNFIKHLILNPGADCFVNVQTTGFFLCASETCSKRVRCYCLKCHCNLPADAIKSCSCVNSELYKMLLNAERYGITGKRKRSIKFEKSVLELSKKMYISLAEEYNECGGNNNNAKCGHPEFYKQFDATGYFYWCPNKDLETCLLDNRNEDLCTQLLNHIVLCSSDTSQGSLRSFILPLRASCLKKSQLRTIIILVDNLDHINKEWQTICNFPQIFIKVGSPLDKKVLRMIRIEQCHMCVVLSGQQSTPSITNSQEDSRALLVTLNIKNLSILSSFVNGNEILNTIHKLFCERQLSTPSNLNHSGNNSTIPMLTELVRSENVQFIEQNNNDSLGSPFYLTQPFACGRAFATRVFDTLTTSTFFSPESYKLVRTFVTGTDSEEHEALLAEGFTEQPCQLTPEKLKVVRNRCSIDLLPLHRGLLEPFAKHDFECLLMNALTRYGILCIGLYRFMSVYDNSRNGDDKRLVITNPSPDFLLHPSDLVYCLCPSILRSKNQNCKSKSLHEATKF